MVLRDYSNCEDLSGWNQALKHSRTYSFKSDFAFLFILVLFYFTVEGRFFLHGRKQGFSHSSPLEEKGLISSNFRLKC